MNAKENQNTVLAVAFVHMCAMSSTAEEMAKEYVGLGLEDDAETIRQFATLLDGIEELDLYNEVERVIIVPTIAAKLRETLLHKHYLQEDIDEYINEATNQGALFGTVDELEADFVVYLMERNK